ncbi:MAG: hypothetical protein M1457_00465 [bacterium]|nr:hypothetical protein [bacterium]
MNNRSRFHLFATIASLGGPLGLGLAMTLAFTLDAPAQNYRGNPPTAHSSMVKPPAPETESPVMRVFEAICWYLPNRIMDFSDIPRFHLAVGDGSGFTVRASRFLYASWFYDESLCLGWTKRMPPVFGEKIEESYFGFLAARQGQLDRDPTELGLSAHLMIVGLNFALSAGEALDALTGIAGIDLAGDDHGPVMFDYAPPPSSEQKDLQQKVYGPQEGANAPADPNAPPPGVANTGMPKGPGQGTGQPNLPATPVAPGRY